MLLKMMQLATVMRIKLFFGAAMPVRSKSEGEFLSPYGRPAYPPTVIKWPGFDGPRPLLSFVLKVLAGKDPGMMRLMLSLTLNERLTDSQSIEWAEASMIATLRQFTDLWIASGKSRFDPDVDTPADRNVEEVLPGQTMSLFRLINEILLNGYPRFTAMKRDGKQVIIDAPPKIETDKVMELGPKRVLELFGRRTAVYWFSKLLDSPYSRRLAHCANCKGYFAYERAPKRTITHGVFCPRCKGSGSVKRTQSTRDRRTKERIECAADSWERWKPLRKYGTRSEWVADRVNRNLKRAGEPITRRWVTQHQAEIEAELERRNHGARKS